MLPYFTKFHWFDISLRSIFPSIIRPQNIYFSNNNKTNNVPFDLDLKTLLLYLIFGGNQGTKKIEPKICLVTPKDSYISGHSTEKSKDMLQMLSEISPVWYLMSPIFLRGLYQRLRYETERGFFVRLGSVDK